MSGLPAWRRQSVETSCTIEIEQTSEQFHAHLALDGELEIRPGDRVRVHGAPVVLAFGQTLCERRLATIERAGWLRRAWTRLAGRFQVHELYDVSFTSRRMR